MENPFNTRFMHGEYTAFINNQIKNLSPGDHTEVDLGGESVSKFRATVQHLATKKKVKYMTKKTKSGAMFVALSTEKTA